MPKKIRFPLEMADGAQVRDLEELREHFDLETVVSYYKNGKLTTWLGDRYLDAEKAAVEALDENAPDFQQRLCAVFGAEYTGEAVDLEEVERRQERLTRLRAFTDESEFIDHIDEVAFDQEDLADLLDEGAGTIYLCGKHFHAPIACANVTYIGINHPMVTLSGRKASDPLPPTLRFRDVELENPPKPPVDFTTCVKGISLSNGRKGFRTIQVELEDVAIIDGVRYDHIPVLSADLFDKLDLHKGDLIRVHRVGDVIPSITIEERRDGKRIELPERCPSCGCGLIREAKKLKCTDPNCPSNKAGRILNFMDRAGIKGVGEAFVNSLVDSGIDNIVKVMETDPDKFEDTGWTKGRIEELQKSLKKKVSEMRDYEVVAAIGFPGVGPEMAKKIIMKCSYDQLAGDETSDRIFYADMVFFSENPNPKSAMNVELILYGEEILKGLRPYIKKFTTKEDFENMKLVGHTGGDPSEDDLPEEDETPLFNWVI